jgi:uroporphyrinogen decarboxylase
MTPPRGAASRPPGGTVPDPPSPVPVPDSGGGPNPEPRAPNCVLSAGGGTDPGPLTTDHASGLGGGASPEPRAPNPSRFLAACRGEAVDRPPVWIMRQAGRYLPEYRETRAEAGSFLALCRDPRLAAEVTLQPLRRFDLDAAIIFSDILLPLAPMGVHFAFPDEGGPRIQEPLVDPGQWARLHVPASNEGTEFVATALAKVREALPPQIALIGFCGAPWTLASYLVEGGTSREHQAVKAAAYTHPEAFRDLLDRLSEAMGHYLLQQVGAGAQAVQVFDSWAGVLPACDYAELVVPCLRRLFDRLSPTGVPRILYLGGSAHLAPVAASLPCEVIGVDWRTDLAAAATAVPGKAVQGNLDPAVLLTTPAVVAEKTRRMRQSAPPRGYIANLGHGILPTTPLANVSAFLAALQEPR